MRRTRVWTERTRRKRPEEDFQAAVLKLARAAGWMTYHTHDSRRSAAGFPDLILVRDGTAIAAELKTGTRQASAAQVEWLEALDGTRVASRLWRPEDMDEIVAMLTAPRPPGGGRPGGRGGTPGSRRAEQRKPAAGTAQSGGRKGTER